MKLITIQLTDQEANALYPVASETTQLEITNSKQARLVQDILLRILRAYIVTSEHCDHGVPFSKPCERCREECRPNLPTRKVRRA